jgi:hypothetical protein
VKEDALFDGEKSLRTNKARLRKLFALETLRSSGTEKASSAHGS